MCFEKFKEPILPSFSVDRMRHNFDFIQLIQALVYVIIQQSLQGTEYIQQQAQKLGLL